MMEHRCMLPCKANYAHQGALGWYFDVNNKECYPPCARLTSTSTFRWLARALTLRNCISILSTSHIEYHHYHVLFVFLESTKFGLAALNPIPALKDKVNKTVQDAKEAVTAAAVTDENPWVWLCCA